MSVRQESTAGSFGLVGSWVWGLWVVSSSLRLFGLRSVGVSVEVEAFFRRRAYSSFSPPLRALDTPLA